MDDAVDRVLKSRFTVVRPFSRNKSHLIRSAKIKMYQTIKGIFIGCQIVNLDVFVSAEELQWNICRIYSLCEKALGSHTAIS